MLGYYLQIKSMQCKQIQDKNLDTKSQIKSLYITCAPVAQLDRALDYGSGG